MKQTLKSRILIYLRVKQPNWVGGYALEKQASEWGYMASNCLRRCRELVNEGRIERKIIGKNVFYRLTQPNFDPNAFLNKLAKEEHKPKQGALL